MVIDRPVSSAVVLSVFQQQALIEHNLRRQLHCTVPMVLNSTLNAIAQNYSEYLAANNLFQHSGRAGLGENLWSMWSSATIHFVNGKRNHWKNDSSSPLDHLKVQRQRSVGTTRFQHIIIVHLDLHQERDILLKLFGEILFN